MTRAEAMADLRRQFGEVTELPLTAEPGYVLAIVEEPQPVPGTSQRTRVAFKLPDPIGDRPPQYVEPQVRTRNGGDPNGARNEQLEGQLWRTWSLNTAWAPARNRLSQLVHTVLSVWDR